VTYALAAGQLVTLSTMAQGLLGRLVAVARRAGVDLPERQVIYMTTVPVDCAQVVVLFNGWQAEPATGEMLQCSVARWAARFGVAITRATPAVPSKGGLPPSASVMSAAAEIASQDAELLLSLLQELGEFLGDVVIETGAPEGAYQTTTLSVVLPAGVI
jgi:hypothetical protein